jgi:hypothetical protein
MTDQERAAERRKDELRREAVEAFRNRYARRYRRRFGADPPGLRPKRIAFLHDGGEEEETERRNRLLGARGAVVVEWWPSLGSDPGAGSPIHGYFVAVGPPEAEEERGRISAAIRRALAGGAYLAVSPSSLRFFAGDGVLRGRRVAFPKEEEESMLSAGLLPAGTALARDGALLTCSLPERIPDLIRLLLDLVHPTSPEGASDR